MNNVHTAVESVVESLQQPHGKITHMQYRTKGHADSNGQKDVLAVRFSDADGGEHVTHIPNGNFDPRNPTLHFLAAIGYKPSDFDGRSIDISDANCVVPLAKNRQTGSWDISQAVLERGKETLAAADWNAWDKDDIPDQT